MAPKKTAKKKVSPVAKVSPRTAKTVAAKAPTKTSSTVPATKPKPKPKPATRRREKAVAHTSVVAAPPTKPSLSVTATKAKAATGLTHKAVAKSKADGRRVAAASAPPPTPPPSPPAPVPDPLMDLVQARGPLHAVLLSLAQAAQRPAETITTAKKKKNASAKDKAAPSAVPACLDYIRAAPATSREAFAEVLAMVAHTLTLLCCGVVQHLTLRTNKAFLKAASCGRTPPTSPCASDADVAEEAPLFSGCARAAPAQADVKADAAQELVYRTVRSTIAASCTLGHRSCQAIWGPRGCGKHRLLRLVAADCARQKSTLVLQLHGDLLRNDVAALRVVADQMFTFLRSPQSAALRAAEPTIESGQFDFGVLFQFPRRLAALAQADAFTPPHHAGRAHSTGTDAWLNEDAQSGSEKSHSSEQEEEEEEDGEEAAMSAEEARMLISSTTAYLAGGAASALSALQRALVLFKSHGVNLVVCVRQADLFGIRCDQLFYVLSGLMHKSDAHGGGISLVLSSSAPDIRQLEKRLSSRLTCETQYIPLLPWTPRRLVRASVALLSDFVRSQLAQLVLADRRLALEHEEEEEALMALAQPFNSASGGGGRGGGHKKAKPAGAREKNESMFTHLPSARVASLETASASVTALADSLAGLLPDNFAPLQWHQWLGHTHQPLLEVAEAWRRRQRAMELKAPAASSWRSARAHTSSLVSDNRPGDVFSRALTPLSVQLGWRPCAKRARSDEDDAEKDAADAAHHEAGGYLDRAKSPEPAPACDEEASPREKISAGVEMTRAVSDVNSVEEDLTLSDVSDDDDDDDQAQEEADEEVESGTAGDAEADAVSGQTESSVAPLDSIPSLLQHPTLTLELLLVLCEQVLHELKSDAPHEEAQGDEDEGARTLAREVRTHTEAQVAAGATASDVLASTIACLTSTASGALRLLSAKGDKAVLTWLSTRLERAQTASATSAALPYLTAAVGGPGRHLQTLVDDEYAGVDLSRRHRMPSASASSAALRLSAWQKLAARTSTGLRLVIAPLAAPQRSPPASLRTQWQLALEAALAQGGVPAGPPSERAAPGSFLPPDMYDLLEEGWIVSLGYLTREAFLVLFYVYQQQNYVTTSTTGGSTARSVGDLLEDVASSLGTRAAAALDRDAYRAAIHQLARWQLLQLSASARQATMDGHASASSVSSTGARRGGGGGGGAGHRDAELVTLCGSKGRLQQFLRLVLDTHVEWCEDTLGLSAKDHMHMRSLV